MNLFSDGQGVTIDLTDLNGVLQYVDTANIPQDSYSKLEIVLSQGATICDNDGQCHTAVFTEMDEKPNKPNVVNCPQGFTDQNGNQLCYIRYNGTINPAVQNKIVVDFDLKEFEVDTSTTPWEITEVKVSPITPSATSTYEMYAVVKNVEGNSLSVSWGGSTYTVSPESTFVCEMGDADYQGQDCMNMLMFGMCVELKVSQDPSTTADLTVVKLETQDMDDYGNGGMRRGGDRHDADEHKERRGQIASVDSQNNQITIGGETYTITDGTVCEINEAYYRIV